MTEPAIDLEAVRAAFEQLVPFNHALGMMVDSASADPAVVVLRLPWAEHLVGNPETGAIHGGALTAALDAAGGAAVFFKLREPVPIATLDLRVDTLKPATTRKDVRARAECFKTTRNVAFVRGVAYHDDPSDPIAAMSATYMLSTKGRSIADRARAHREEAP